MANQDLAVDILGLFEPLLCFQLGCPGDVLVVFAEIDKLGLHGPGLFHAAQVHQRIDQFHANSLLLRIELQ